MQDSIFIRRKYEMEIRRETDSLKMGIHRLDSSAEKADVKIKEDWKKTRVRLNAGIEEGRKNKARKKPKQNGTTSKWKLIPPVITSGRTGMKQLLK